MNRFAELVDRLASASDAEMRQRLHADYASVISASENTVAHAILDRTLALRRLKLSLIRGLAEERLDPVLFDLSLKYVGDVSETIALLWPARLSASQPPTLVETVEALATLGRSELPRRIEAWLDACDVKGRWALIKLLTGTFPAGAARPAKTSAAQPAFTLTGDEKAPPGTLDALLMYVARDRTRSAGLICTFGVWNGVALTPLGKAPAGPWQEQIEAFAVTHAGKRFGPVTEVTCTPDIALVLQISYAGLQPALRRKSGLSLQSPQITAIGIDRSPSAAATLPSLLLRLPAHQRRAK